MDGFVYLIGPLEGYHKIGRSKDPSVRVTQLGTYPVPLGVVTTISTSKSVWLEQYLHAAFAHRRGMGEWFKLEPDEVEMLKGVHVANSPLDLPEPLRDLWKNHRPAGADTDEAFAAQIGECIRRERLTAGFTLALLSEVTGIQIPQLSRLESASMGLPNLSTLNRIANALGVPLSWMVEPPAVRATAAG